MMKRILVLSVITCLITLSCPCGQVLVIKEEEGGLTWTQDISVGDLIEMTSIHSLSLSPISVIFKVTGDFELKAIEVLYVDQGGAGMPESLENPTFELSQFKGTLSDTYKRFDLIVEPSSETCIAVKDTRIEMSEAVTQVAFFECYIMDASILNKLMLGFGSEL